MELTSGQIAEAFSRHDFEASYPYLAMTFDGTSSARGWSRVRKTSSPYVASPRNTWRA